MNSNPSEQDGINLFDQINSICSSFQRQLKHGQSPRIEDLLGTFDGSARETLFRNLLNIDIDYRRQSGSTPTSDEYVKRFPEFSRVIRQAFFEPTIRSMQSLNSTPADASLGGTRTLDLPAVSKLGDYELLGELGRGGFGVVYEACHVQRQNHVALKTLPTAAGNQSSFEDAERLHKFRREFRSLAEVNHPNLVGMQTLEVEGNQWFFTMDLIGGQDFLSYVRPSGELDESRLRQSLPQLVAGIMTLHGQHILHRDLKPNNVLVNQDGQLVILDFGMVIELNRRTDVTRSLQSQHFAGTPKYAAPEQMFGRHTAASDWYAMGTMMYEALEGKTPHTGKTAAELMFNKQNSDAPPLHGRADLPPDLAQLTDELLKRDPQQRCDALAIARVLSVDVRDPSHDSSAGPLTKPTSDSGRILIGRGDQLEQLENCLQRLIDTRKAEVVLVSGQSGEGKTSLVEKYLAPRRLDERVLVLSGRCYDRESVPYKAVDCIIDALVGFLRSRKPEQVNELLPTDIEILAQLFPVLQRVESISQLHAPSVDGVDRKQIRERAFNAMRELLKRISDSTPIIMFIDDLQWGDGDSADVLAELMMADEPPVTLLIGSYRSDEADESPFLANWNSKTAIAETELSTTSVSVGPLTAAQCTELVILRTGIDNDTVCEKAHELYQSTGGNPYFLEQLIECFDPDTGAFTPAPLTEVIETRLTRLPSNAGRLLEVISVSGQAIPLAEASLAAGEERPAMTTITHMRNERLLRLIGSDEQQTIDTYHDKIRETVIDQLSLEDRQELHLRIADTIEQQEQQSADQLLNQLDEQQTIGDQEPVNARRVFDLAYHLHEAKDARSFVYQLLAGEESLRAYAADEAQQYFARAEELLPNKISDQVRHRLYAALGITHTTLRTPDEAVHYYQLAFHCAPTAILKAQAKYGEACVITYSGRMSDARNCVDQALGALGKKRPATAFRKILSGFSSAFQIAVMPASWQKASDPQAAEISRLEHDLYLRLGSYSWEYSVSEWFHCAMSQAKLSVRSGIPDVMACGYNCAAATLSEMSLTSLANRCRRRAIKLGDREGAPYNISRSCFFRTICLRRDAKWSEAADEIERAFEFIGKVGTEDLALGTFVMQRTLCEYAPVAREFEWANRLMSYSTEFDNMRGLHWGYCGLAAVLARAGNIAEAFSQLRQDDDVPPLENCFASEAICMGDKGYVLLQASEYERASKILEECWALIKSRFLYNSLCIRALPHLIIGLVGPRWRDERKNVEAKRLRSLVRGTRIASMMVLNFRSLMLRARGRIFWTLGKQSRALRCFERAVDLDRKQGSNSRLALSLLDLAAVKEDGREENRAEAIELLKQLGAVIPYAERWLLGDEPDMQVVAPDNAPNLSNSEAGL